MNHAQALELTQTGRRRIRALKDGGSRPLMNAVPEGPASPSPSLVVERLELADSGEQTHRLEGYVLTLFFKPTSMLYASDQRRTSELSIAPGQVVLCVPKDDERVAWREPLSMLCAQIGEPVLDQAARVLTGHERLTFSTRPLAEDPRLAHLLNALEAERARGYPSGRLFLDSVEAALAATLVTFYAASTPRPVKGTLGPRRLSRVLEFMRASLGKQASLTDFAASVDLSVSHFAQQFRESMGVTPYQYMLTLRIERAKALLTGSQLSVLAVAIEVGFANAAHFATVFRRAVGVSPSAYRRGS